MTHCRTYALLNAMRPFGRRLRSLDVLAGAGVDLDLVPFVDKEGDVDDKARFQCRRLGRSCRRVTLHPRITMSDGEVDRGRQLDPDRLVAQEQHIARAVLCQEVLC